MPRAVELRAASVRESAQTARNVTEIVTTPRLSNPRWVASDFEGSRNSKVALFITLAERDDFYILAQFQNTESQFNFCI